jgi:hypothetical protein
MIAKKSAIANQKKLKKLMKNGYKNELATLLLTKTAKELTESSANIGYIN